MKKAEILVFLDVKQSVQKIKKLAIIIKIINKTWKYFPLLMVTHGLHKKWQTKTC